MGFSLVSDLGRVAAGVYVSKVFYPLTTFLLPLEVICYPGFHVLNFNAVYIWRVELEVGLLPPVQPAR
jgi:hypothetical protein